MVWFVCSIFVFWLFRVCESFPTEGLSHKPIVTGLVEQLQKIFPREPLLEVERAVSDGLARATHDENLEVGEVTCMRDYSRLCPDGWADAGDGDTCLAPRNYAGACGARLHQGGLTAKEKFMRASKCGVSYSCTGFCSQDYSNTCPLGWMQDINQDCLAPVEYSGKCVVRKSFADMGASDKSTWAKLCDVTWPCRKTQRGVAEIARLSIKGVFNSDCIPDYSVTCPERFIEKDGRCLAPPTFSGRCGASLDSTKYTQREKAAYAEACLTPWPCSGDLSAARFAVTR